MKRNQKVNPKPPTPGWAIYLRTSSDENQKPELSRARQRVTIEQSVLQYSDMPVYGEYVDVQTGSTPNREEYQRMLKDARAGLFSHVIVERADRFGRNDTEALRAIDELDKYGVAVRFANAPTLDPMGMEDRILVGLSFTLARRESALLSVRVRGGLRAKRQNGGFCGRAPDGYRNVCDTVSGEAKKLNGRFQHWIEIDPDRAPIWRLAWKLLVEEEMTLVQICEELHARGYTYRSGRPFIRVNKHGVREAARSNLSRVFNNWTYAGWLVSETGRIPPKTIRGNWEPTVSTEVFEKGLSILSQRDQKQGRQRKHDYLLKGLLYLERSDGIFRMTCSTPNSARSGGGTPYYVLKRTSFLCRAIDEQIPELLHNLQIDEEYLPAIREAYNADVARQFNGDHVNEREDLQAVLKSIDEAEDRMLHLYTSGKVSDSAWNKHWNSWEDRRASVNARLEILSSRSDDHINSLDAALNLIAKVGIMYNELTRADQKELLRNLVERVVVNAEGKVRLELLPPFTYLKQLDRQAHGKAGAPQQGTKKTARRRGSQGRSVTVQSCWGGWIRTNEWRIQSPLPYHLATPHYVPSS